jgi:hypothetical protein
MTPVVAAMTCDSLLKINNDKDYSNINFMMIVILLINNDI